MRAVWVLAGRELRGFLRSPLGYALLAVYALASGLIFVTLLFLLREQLLRAAQPAAGSALPPAVSMQLSVVAPYFINVASLWLFIVPFVTMRCFAEERRTRSLEVLVSYPLALWQIVFGKLLGVLAFSALLIGISVVHMVILTMVSSPELLPIATGLLGLGLLVLGLVTIGVCVSSLAVGQVEAAVLTLGLFLLAAMGGAVVRPGASAWQTVFVNLSPLYHFMPFARGLLPAGGVLFFLAVAFLFAGLTLRGVDLIKWRG